MKQEFSWTGKPADAGWVLPEGLQQLIAAGDGDTVIEIIDMFRGDTAIRIERLRRAVERFDRGEIHAQAHAIKGGSMQVGVNGMAMICRQIEGLAQDASPGAIADLTARLIAEFQAISRVIEEDAGGIGGPECRIRYEAQPENRR